MKHELSLAVLGATLVAILFTPCSLRAGAPQTKSKPPLSQEQREELEKANKILSQLDTYKKSLFTRLLNSGKRAHLIALPGVGETTADRIIKERPYDTSAHVVLVKGVGLRTFDRMVKSRR